MERMKLEPRLWLKLPTSSKNTHTRKLPLVTFAHKFFEVKYELHKNDTGYSLSEALIQLTQKVTTDCSLNYLRVQYKKITPCDICSQILRGKVWIAQKWYRLFFVRSTNSINPKSDDRLFVELLTSSVQENYPLWLLLTNSSR